MLKKILILKTNNTLIQLFRYGFVGGTAFVVDFSVLYLLTEYLNVYYLLSATISFILGILVNYVMSIIWVFKYRNFSKKIYEIAIFIIIGVVFIGLAIAFCFMVSTSDSGAPSGTFSRICRALILRGSE